MMRSITVRRILVAGLAATTALFVAACGGNGADHEAMGSTTPPPGATGFNEADVNFVQMMIPHHEQAVEMAELAESRASDPEVKQIAAQVLAAQEPEITTMTGWLTAWGVPATGGHEMPGMSGTEGMPGMASEQEMGQLEAATGVDFDRMFARMMIAHHNGAIQMARDVSTQGMNPEVKALASAIEQSQAAEVTQLEAILDRL
jgi:uncharacterized protein (DUF305 family)